MEFQITAKAIPPDAAVFMGSRYVFYDWHENWYAALDHCRKLGGKLVSNNSQNELNFLTSLIKEKGYTKTDLWLGACNLHEEDQWKWTNLSTYALNNVIERDEKNRYLTIQNETLTAMPNTSHYGKAFICEWEGDGELLRACPKVRIPRAILHSG